VQTTVFVKLDPVPRISDELRAARRRHILTSAWTCFARDGFHATSMDDVIAATGLSSSSVYRYFRSKDELIDAAGAEALALTRDLFTRLLSAPSVPTPIQTLAALIDELRVRSTHPEYDLTKIAMQAWTEALRRPPLRERTRTVYLEARAKLGELARRWREAGDLPPEADPDAVATVLFTLVPGAIVTHHLVAEASADDLAHGLAALGAAVWNSTSTTWCSTASADRSGGRRSK
jgi:AcrR family transcriptional regulator